MAFKIGDTVIYPHHGAALIEDISEKTIRGEKRLYLTLHVQQGDLVIQVPAESIEQVGVRDVSSEEQLERVFAVLREDNVEEPTNWSRRFKANTEKLSSGDVAKVAEVIRDLTRRETDRHLSAGEKQLLSQARQILGSEVALARQLTDLEASALLDDILGTISSTSLAVRLGTSDSADEADASGESAESAESAE